jgi:diguanylate cyclase (GGDEF)-like protein
MGADGAEKMIAAGASGQSAPLFIVSFRHRDELTRLCEGAGWRPIAARRSANAEARFIASGAAVAIVDARGSLEEGREAVRLLADPVEANAAALLVLVSRTDAEAVDQFHQDGATHFLVSPFPERQFLQALLFARRHAERVGGGARHARRGSEEGADAPSWSWEPGSRTVELSPALARKAGLGGEDGRRMSLLDLFRKLDSDGRKAARGAIDRLVATGEATAFAHRDSEGGNRLAHHLRLSADQRSIVGRTETISPRTAAAAAQSRDPLTGLRDGKAARAWITTRLAAAPGRGPVMIALLLAVSRFDAINAAFGRSTGDAVLQAVARRIERQVDPDMRNRFVARMAGAEFAILLTAPASLAEGRFLAGQLVETIARPFMSGDHAITLASRVGVVGATADDDAASLLRRASAALAEARSAESAPVRVLDESSESDSALADQLAIDLRRALDQDEIEIRFQPQVSITTGAIEGAEALARWRHPRYGELGAITLFTVAERSDYLAQLSDHVQRKAITEAAAWPDALKAQRLSVNITAADILRPGFAAQFIRLVEESGFPAGRLTVEVTEGGLIEDLGAAARLLSELRRGGLRVAIDDFGTGYSSLAYLKALPLDYLKIDKRLSEDIVGSPRDRIVVRGVIDMARSLGLSVIAEGVETEEQLGLLAREGCNLFQGFLCSPPVTSAEFVALAAPPQPG